MYEVASIYPAIEEAIKRAHTLDPPAGSSRQLTGGPIVTTVKLVKEGLLAHDSGLPDSEIARIVATGVRSAAQQLCGRQADGLPQQTSPHQRRGTAGRCVVSGCVCITVLSSCAAAGRGGWRRRWRRRLVVQVGVDPKDTASVSISEYRKVRLGEFGAAAAKHRQSRRSAEHRKLGAG